MMIKNITIGGKAIESDRDYTFATNSYLYNGGYLQRDGVCRDFKVREEKVTDIVVDYIKEHSPISSSGREVGTHVEY